MSSDYELDKSSLLPSPIILTAYCLVSEFPSLIVYLRLNVHGVAL